MTALGLSALLLGACGSTNEAPDGSINLEIVFPDWHTTRSAAGVSTVSAVPPEIGYVIVEAFLSGGETRQPLAMNDTNNPRETPFLVLSIDLTSPTELVFEASARAGQEGISLYQGVKKALINPTVTNTVTILMGVGA